MNRAQSNKILAGIIIGIVLAATLLPVFGKKLIAAKFPGQFLLKVLRMIIALEAVNRDLQKRVKKHKWKLHRFIFTLTN